MEEELFKRSKVKYEALIGYGFTLEKDTYKYSKNILDNTFKIEVSIKNNKVLAKVFDLEFMEEYTNFRVEKQTGEFASTIKEKLMNTLLDIKQCCFIDKYFVSDQANRIASILEKKYESRPEFLWKKYPTDAIFRNRGKWYALIMRINKIKLDNKTDKEVDILNVKLDEELIKNLLKKKGFYQAYHMNKDKWLTIVVDDTLQDDEIISYIDMSYNFTV